MFEKVSQVAEQVATSVSRRGFLGKFGRGAMTLAASVGGLLALPGDAEAAGGARCCGSGRCSKPHGHCTLVNSCLAIFNSRCSCYLHYCVWNCSGTTVNTSCNIPRGDL